MTDPAPFVEVINVSKAFRETRRVAEPIDVIDNVSMTLVEGEFVAFLGPSGCGKTTLIRIVGGLESVTSGEVLLGREKITGPDHRKGMVFQTYTSFPWLTVAENVHFGTKYRKDISKKKKQEISDHYLNLVGLTKFANFYVSRISGGMRQRVAIARTLAAQPDILLMDEPFGALDAQTREHLQVQIREISRLENKTVIFVTHDVEEAIFLSDRIFIFSARPACVVEEIDVTKKLPAHRDMKTKETEVFFHLSNYIRDVMRNLVVDDTKDL